MTIQRWARRGVIAIVAVTTTQSSVPRYWGFTAPWDERSDASIGRHDAALGAVISAWIGIDSASGMPLMLYPDDAPRSPTPRFAMLTTASEGRFHPDVLHHLANGFADSVARLLARGRYRG